MSFLSHFCTHKLSVRQNFSKSTYGRHASSNIAKHKGFRCEIQCFHHITRSTRETLLRSQRRVTNRGPHCISASCSGSANPANFLSFIDSLYFLGNAKAQNHTSDKCGNHIAGNARLLMISTVK